jgi:hypothetical protein
MGLAAYRGSAADGPYRIAPGGEPVETFIRLRIVVLQIDPEAWCEFCAAACAVTVTYVVEDEDAPVAGVHQLTYCDSERH